MKKLMKSLTFSGLMISTLLTFFAQVKFKDQADIQTWAKDQIKKLQKLNLLILYPDETFRPNNRIKRAEFSVNPKVTTNSFVIN